MGFFISEALAAAPATSVPQAGGGFSLIMIIAIFVLFYFMLIRPQSKRAKEHRELVQSLKKGDEVVTAGGILAKVVSLGDQFVKVSLAEGVEITVQRNSITTVLPKGTLKSLF